MATEAITPLRRQLAGEAVGRQPSALDAFLAARRRFVAGERVDMTALAVQVGVNRVTLYRWVGSREQLLVEVVWSLARRTLDDLEAKNRKPTHPQRAVKILTEFLGATIAHPGMQRWLAEEGESAMKLLTRHDTDFQPRLIAAVEALIDPADPDRHEVAYALVRVIESYTYLDLITGETPDAGRARPIFARLLQTSGL
ncbi:QsdR family transcriptional regulator [Baekduia sp. Peel2402]|uniref:QsdR family transcriptional regulator n=1 Tax=Baekduia sp. Peel2402 TaxID=3458296 RepID=UPI00403E7717